MSFGLVSLSCPSFSTFATLCGNSNYFFGYISLTLYTFSYQRTYIPKPYHIIQEIQKYNIPDYRPRQEWFRKAVHKVRAIQRVKQTRGFAFSQSETGQAALIRSYDTSIRKPKG